jgi:hypothetical protein
MGLDSNSNVVDYKYPRYVLSLIDQWGSGYTVLLQGFGGPADDQRVRDLLAGLEDAHRVDWNNCRKYDRAEEVSEEFPMTPAPPA